MVLFNVPGECLNSVSIIDWYLTKNKSQNVQMGGPFGHFLDKIEANLR